VPGEGTGHGFFGRVRATIGRASDFYGPFARQSTAGERIFGRALRGQPAQVLGDPDLPHTYTFIDDFAGALVTLGERDEAVGRVWHVPSAETVTTRQFVQMVFDEAGTPMRLSMAPEWAISTLARFNPTLRAVKEQAYQRTSPWVVDHTAFAQAFGARPTPHREAIRQTLRWYQDSIGADLSSRRRPIRSPSVPIVIRDPATRGR
jgi:nucleoside-diphosphate-sugar epimerase